VVKKPKASEVTAEKAERKIQMSEIGSLFHSLLFSYEDLLIDMYGKHAREMLPYLVERLALFDFEKDGILLPGKPLEENLAHIQKFLSHADVIQDVKIAPLGNNGYKVEVKGCAFAKAGIHKTLKLKEGPTCPWVLLIAGLLQRAAGDKYDVHIGSSEFTDEDTYTTIELKVPETQAPGAAGSVPVEQAQGEPTTFLQKEANIMIDPLDARLMEILRYQGRRSNIELAAMLKTSESTVRRRINDLTRRGLIRGFSALLDYTKLGHFLRGNVYVLVDEKHCDDLAAKLAKLDLSCGVYKVMGEYNLAAEILFRDMRELQNLMDSISKTEGVKKVGYLLATVPYKACAWFGA
jgi:Lrp/AsnC family transcriptional regulator for asnA, asnC and gidA